MFQQKIAIPTYFRRGPNGDPDWGKAVTAKPELSVAVINPDSGPGYTSSFQPGGDEHVLCQRRIDQMQDEAGAAVVGYLTTNYRDEEGKSVQSDYRFTVDLDTLLVTLRLDTGDEKETVWPTGFGPIRVDSKSTLPAGLEARKNYWWIAESLTTGRFAGTQSDAHMGNAVEIRSAGDPGPQNANHFMGLSRRAEHIDNVKFEIDEFYRKWPGIDGIFFDEMKQGKDEANKTYYRSIFNYVKEKAGRDALVIQNPGTTFDAELADCANIFLSFESDNVPAYREYEPGWQTGHPTAEFWHTIHSCSEQNMPEVLALSRKYMADYIYVTGVPEEDGRPAPNIPVWERIATYFDRELVIIRAANNPPDQ
ncbi:spherulation-specific family 4 protein [Kocuria sabuli]|uniref:spherulation-specific family 4 protein n=1 Tax=Kocuria sabuli TaxID=3071448 RepID=UPI0034D6C3DE